MQTLTSILPQVEALGSIDWLSLLKTVLIFAVVIFAVGTVIRMILGKGSSLTCAVSACISILLVYLAAILIYLFLPDWRAELPQLPFLTVDAQHFALWRLSDLTDSLLYASVLKLGILAFLVNLLEVLLPKGEKFSTWYLFRTVTVLAALAGYGALIHFLDGVVPELFTLWAKPLVLGFWAVILLSGVLKVLLSIVLTVMNPIVGALYTFFFSNLLGKQFSKSILTTVILVGVVEALNRLGATQFAFSDFSLAAYGPACLILIGTLYLFGRFL